MKYLAFTFLSLMLVPATALLSSSSRVWKGRLLALLIFSVALGDVSNINFLSMETYRGPERGFEVSLTDAGRSDKLLRGFPEKFGVLLGHKEACDTTPEGATLLVTGDACPVQMFRVGENVYATQFHPEADIAEFKLRIDIYKHHGYFAPEEAEDTVAGLGRFDTSRSNEILSRFVREYGPDR